MATNGWALMAMDWSADCSEKAMDAQSRDSDGKFSSGSGGSMGGGGRKDKGRPDSEGFYSEKDRRAWAKKSPTYAKSMKKPAQDAGDGWSSMCKGWGGGAAMDDFKSVEESAAKSGASDPGGVAYAVGVKKYGKEGMEAKAEAGKK